MRAQKIFDTAVTLMFGTEEDKVDYLPLFLNILNLLLAENFDTNNALRELGGKEALLEVPEIKDILDDVPYEDIFTRNILPYGCAGYIYTDDDKNVGTEYKNKYEAERARLLKTAYMDIGDVR